MSKRLFGVFVLIISALLIWLDYLTKSWALASLMNKIEITSWFNFQLAFNKGAAFSFLADAGGWQRWFFIIFAIGVSGYLLIAIFKNQLSKISILSYGLVFAGAIGNLYDRINHGYVIDFVQFHYQNQYYFPTFNIADMAISFGVILLIISFWFDRKKANQIISEQ